MIWLLEIFALASYISCCKDTHVRFSVASDHAYKKIQGESCSAIENGDEKEMKLLTKKREGLQLKLEVIKIGDQEYLLSSIMVGKYTLVKAYVLAILAVPHLEVQS